MQQIKNAPSRETLDNPLMLRRFGRTWREPFYEGYLIVDGRYIDAPYVLEQRGAAAYINGVRVDYPWDVESVFYVSSFLYADPGVPTNLVRETTVAELCAESIVRQKAKYLLSTGSSGQPVVDSYCDYLRRLPCVSNVVDTGLDSASNVRDIVVSDFLGATQTVNVAYEYSDDVSRSDKCVVDDFGQVLNLTIVEGLSSGGVIFSTNGCFSCGWLGNASESTNSLITFALPDLPLTQRVSRLKELFDLQYPADTHFDPWIYPLNGIQVTSQFWQRVSGDMSWTNDAPQRLLKMTNGWKIVLPDYVNVPERRQRTQEMEEKVRQAAIDAEDRARTKAMEAVAAEEVAQRRRILIQRTRRIRQDSLSAMLAEAQNPKEEHLLPDVTHWILSATNHLYSIKVHTESAQLDCLTPQACERPTSPAIREVEFVRSNMVLLVLADGLLTNLPTFVDGLARIGSLCYWNEMEMRTKKSPHFEAHLFESIANAPSIQAGLRQYGNILASTETNGVLNILSFSLVSNELKVVSCELVTTGNVLSVSYIQDKVRQPLDDTWKTRHIRSSSTLSINGGKTEVVINAVRAMCDRVKQTVVRVFDNTGKYIWESPQSFANVTLYCTDMNGDGMDDIVVRSEDHGSITFVVYEQRPISPTHRDSAP